MNLRTSLPELIGDLTRFGALADRVEGLVDGQVARYLPSASDWIVLPWTDGFYLFSEDSEGQRRGREVVLAFLGPNLVSVETVPDERLASNLPAQWKSRGLVRASHLRRVERSREAAEEMLSRLEDMTVSMGGRTRHVLEIKPTHSDLLRDFRLALLSKDDESARSLLDQVRLNGHVSSENLRYLRIEYFAAFDRWTEMRSMPHISALLQARRPRAVSESLLRMLWWTEIAGPAHASPQMAFRDRGVLEDFGPLLRSVRVPTTPEARLICYLAAMADEDDERLKAILESAEHDERARLEALAAQPVRPSLEEAEEPSPEPADPAVEAYAVGRFAEVIKIFLADPRGDRAELAISAVLDSGATDRATQVLQVVRELDARGGLTLSRRGRRDLDELRQLVDDSCPGWFEWAARLAGDPRWADASAVVRDNASSWTPIASLASQDLSAVCDALLEASGGTNADQLRASLDVLCNEAAATLARGVVNDFCQVVLALLSEQSNFSEMVRSAYIDLFAAWLEVGPSADQYREVLDQSLDIWTRIASPVAVSWAVGLLEAAADSPCPDRGKRDGLAVQLVEGSRRYYSRLSLRERVEVEGLADDLGLPAQAIEAQEAERDAWSALNGKLVGIYSLLPRAGLFLRSRLTELCAVGEIRDNQDKVATAALRSLAERADYLIVDTWHAAHQATGAIDAVRPRDRQIMPRQRGLSGFLRALEEALAA